MNLNRRDFVYLGLTPLLYGAVQARPASRLTPWIAYSPESALLPGLEELVLDTEGMLRVPHPGPRGPLSLRTCSAGGRGCSGDATITACGFAHPGEIDSSHLSSFELSLNSAGREFHFWSCRSGNASNAVSVTLPADTEGQQLRANWGFRDATISRNHGLHPGLYLIALPSAREDASCWDGHQLCWLDPSEAYQVQDRWGRPAKFPFLAVVVKA